MTVLNVSCAAEGDYVFHSAAMLHSVISGNPSDEVHIHYLHGPDLSAHTRSQLAHMVEQAGGALTFLEIPDAWCAGLPTAGFTRKATWYRIFLPQVLPDVERILYLDADAIVVESLRSLWDLDLSEQYVAAVTNVFEPHFAYRPAELGLAGPHAYFNAGVLMMNLDLMRRDGCTDALLAYATAHEQLLWRDQDALNVVLGHRRLPLHPRWNCMNSVLLFPWSAEVFGTEAVSEARARPAIRHFEGPSVNKPWHYLCALEHRDLYFRHRRQTPWPRARIEGRTPRNVWERLRWRMQGRAGRSGTVPGGPTPSVLDR